MSALKDLAAHITTTYRRRLFEYNYLRQHVYSCLGIAEMGINVAASEKDALEKFAAASEAYDMQLLEMINDLFEIEDPRASRLLDALNTAVGTERDAMEEAGADLTLEQPQLRLVPR